MDSLSGESGLIFNVQRTKTVFGICPERKVFFSILQGSEKPGMHVQEEKKHRGGGGTRKWVYPSLFARKRRQCWALQIQSVGTLPGDLTKKEGASEE